MKPMLLAIVVAISLATSSSTALSDGPATFINLHMEPIGAGVWTCVYVGATAAPDNESNVTIENVETGELDGYLCSPVKRAAP